ncbi:LacI family DNA-binding transcriptional regulator [Psychrosphaera sp. 1_MG-2023]|uniref:LacI family DNA-binding transcriptional regulator n=1 Tax=Psychrosphaera sp. 1_MG-2023 TaxID=3062643 RepID=UPI0026E37293|nr:LacI family DNA-binding transcriptional regulator [Psychrosphaera sp. 1_MG-2023]MDO6719939.1 LacI family DNA-binding transcriptional regulator [Psychrosphaera sp. 1_MG-2023]
MSTIKDVARIAGVSIATVSRVVNKGPKVGEKTRNRVLKIMQEIGYMPNANARALVTQKNTTIGVVIPDLTDPFFASLAHGVDKIAREKNMQVLLSTGLISESSERQAINLLLERRCDAVVIHSKKLSDDELVELSKRVPGLILIDRFIERIKHRCVWLDNAEGGKLAARHLLAMAHNSFACITSQYEIDDPLLRLQGFKDGILDAGFTLENKLIAKQEPTLQGGEIAAQELLSQNIPFSALFVYNDAMAIGAISTFEDNGFRVPQDISVIGFDDVLLSRYSRPKLTTLNYPIEDMAANAALLALEYRESPEQYSAPEGLKYLPSLVTRESTIRNKSR